MTPPEDWELVEASLSQRHLMSDGDTQLRGDGRFGWCGQGKSTKDTGALITLVTCRLCLRLELEQGTVFYEASKDLVRARLAQLEGRPVLEPETQDRGTPPPSTPGNARG